MSIDDAICDFIHYCIFEKGLSDKTRISYQNDLKIYQLFLKERGIVQAKDISSDHIKEFLKVRHQDESVSTIAHNLTVIKNFHLYLFRQKIVKQNVSEFIERPKLKKRLPKALSVEEVNLLLDIPFRCLFDYRNKAMLELMYGTGIRVSELVSLTVNDVDLENCFIRVFGKGSKERIVPIGEYCIYYLNLYLEKRNLFLKKKNCDNLFLNNHGLAMTRQGFYKIIKNLLKEKGLNPDVSPHSFRHSFATHLINYGADLRSIQEMLGHADISTTKIYTEKSDEKVIDDYYKFHPRSHKI